jgi:hypothetical protein
LEKSNIQIDSARNGEDVMRRRNFGDNSSPGKSQNRMYDDDDSRYQMGTSWCIHGSPMTPAELAAAMSIPDGNKLVHSCRLVAT